MGWRSLKSLSCAAPNAWQHMPSLHSLAMKGYGWDPRDEVYNALVGASAASAFKSRFARFRSLLGVCVLSCLSLRLQR
jgi:hypothetical protein